MRLGRLLALLVTFAAVPFASATSVRALDVAALSAASDLVVLGTPEAAESYWDGGRIRTRTQVRIAEVWAGAGTAGESVEVTTLGGVVGDIGQRISGASELTLGSELVLFLRRAHGRLVPVELGQGVFYVSYAPDGTAQVARGKSADAGLAAGTLPTTLDGLRQAVAEQRRAK